MERFSPHWLRTNAATEEQSFSCELRSYCFLFAVMIIEGAVWCVRAYLVTVNKSDIKIFLQCSGHNLQSIFAMPVVCIGIGYGKVLRGGAAGVFGDEMNLASKLGEDTAEGGETLLTKNAYARVKKVSSVRFEEKRVAISGNDIRFYAAKR